MRLPNAEYATVDRRKLVDYLLARSHPMGCSKAVWFEAFGFSAENWPQLAAALAEHACRQPVVSSMGTPYGAKFIVEGPLP
jgi:filamentous hemagglutinin